MREAILFGFNYTEDSGARLNGCINDVHHVKKFLEPMGFNVSLISDRTNPEKGTRNGIINTLQDAMLRTHHGTDTLWIHFSCHGSTVPDSRVVSSVSTSPKRRRPRKPRRKKHRKRVFQDELDGKDECVVPLDFRNAGFLLDDTIADIFSKASPDCRILCVFDCCHSGTIVDVKYSWERDKAPVLESTKIACPAKMITISGCMDNQTSSDVRGVYSGGRWGGALTSTLVSVSKRSGILNDSFRLVREVRQELKNKGHSQIPILGSSYNLERNCVFLPSN